jgi:hypothetical protein
MSLRWPAKDPSEILNYSVDWSRFLASDTILSATWFIYDADGVKTEVGAGVTVDGLTVQSVGRTSTVASIKVSAGTLNKEYKIVCQITFNTSALVAERTIILPIKDR